MRCNAVRGFDIFSAGIIIEERVKTGCVVGLLASCVASYSMSYRLTCKLEICDKPLRARGTRLRWWYVGRHLGPRGDALRITGRQDERAPKESHNEDRLCAYDPSARKLQQIVTYTHPA